MKSVCVLAVYTVCMLMQPLRWPNMKIIEAQQAKICNSYKMKDAQYLYWNNWVNIFPCNHDTQLHSTWCHNAEDSLNLYLCSRVESCAEKISPEKNSCTQELPGSFLCPVCLDRLKFHNPSPEQQVMSTQCGHVFCSSCIAASLYERKKCPVCCKRQSIRNIHPLYL